MRISAVTVIISSLALGFAEPTMMNVFGRHRGAGRDNASLVATVRLWLGAVQPCPARPPLVTFEYTVA
jgi:hypothetical protein